MALDTIFRILGAGKVREKLLAIGWHEKHFRANQAIAMNPVYENFSLGMSDTWIPGGMIDNGVDKIELLIYPADDLESIFDQASFISIPNGEKPNFLPCMDADGIN